MRIPKYWIQSTIKAHDNNGASKEIAAWGWSNYTLEEAKSHGLKKAKAIVEKLKIANYPTNEKASLNDYDYCDTPPREEIINTIGDQATGSEPATIITRNRYGSLILNSAHVLFVDIDIPPLPTPKGIIAKLRFALSASYKKKVEIDHHFSVVTQITTWSEKNPDYSFRVYQTKAGFRLLFTNKRFDPKSDEVKKIFNELRSDPLYQKLTEKQNCFRARLSPKPWRIGLSRPKSDFPRQSAEQKEFQQWLSRYKTASTTFSTCRPLQVLGEYTNDDPLIDETISLHDAQCRSHENFPLA